MVDDKKIEVIDPLNIKTIYSNTVLDMAGEVIINHNVVFKNCTFRYIANEEKKFHIFAEVEFVDCVFNCVDYAKGDSGFIVVGESGGLKFKQCKFESCEKFIEGYDKFLSIEIRDSVLNNPGNLFLNVQARDKAKIALSGIEARVMENVTYSGNTTVFRIARWGMDASIELDNIKITSANFKDNVKWFDCMGAQLSKGEFVNLSNVLFGFRSVVESKFVSCKKTINWSFPVVRDYGISKNTISWINENTLIEKCDFTNCTMIAGLGKAAKVRDCKFRKCFAPIAVIGQLGGVHISHSRLISCVLDGNDNNAFIICVMDQDKDFTVSKISNVQCENTQLSKNKFLRLDLAKDKYGIEKAYGTVFSLENLRFINCGLSTRTELIRDIVGKQEMRVVSFTPPIDFHNDPVESKKTDIDSDKTGADWFGDI